MASKTRPVRMYPETIAKLRRLSRVLGRTFAELLGIYVDHAYQKTKEHPKKGPLLREIEEQDLADEQEVEAKPRRRSGAVIRLNAEEARQLALKAVTETGDPREASRIGRAIIRDRLLEERGLSIVAGPKEGLRDL